MFLKLTKQLGKPICVALYAVFAALAAKKKPLPLLILLALHSFEYVTKGRRIAADHGLSAAEGAAQCLAFGFTWWLPLEKGL
ncbi:MAG: hypothetical protein IJJ43_01520 [Oscillospiraceae bacterium]|nr:hypothetical protein [Oscillospiraceae bacterium]